MTAEDRAAHVEREAVAGVLAAHQKVAWGMGAGSRDKCRCGAETMYAPGDEEVSIRRDRAFAAHQADAVLAALPQAGDAAGACVVVPCDADCEAACHMVHQPEHKREVRVIADDPVQRAASWRHVRAAWLAGQLAGRRAALGADQ